MIQILRFLYRAWKYKSRTDKAEVQFIRSNINHGDTVIDIGAHKGAYLYWLLKSVGPTGKVVAFEAQPSLVEYLKNICSTLNYSNVKINWLGISSQQGELELVIPNILDGTSPSASFVAGSKKESDHYTIRVKVDTLDRFFSDPDLRPVSFIKCDVEGHELEVFRGGEKLLKSDQPTLLFECEARHIQSGSMQEVFSYLENLGYNGYFFKNDLITPIEEFDVKKHQETIKGNIINRHTYFNNFIFTTRKI